MSYFGATGTPVLDFWWRLLWVSKPEWFCLIRIAEANVMYISWDPPLVLHVADLLTDSIAGRRPGSYLAQGYYCVAAVSLEPTINRSWVPRANHSATRPGPKYVVTLFFFYLDIDIGWSFGDCMYDFLSQLDPVG